MLTPGPLRARLTATVALIATTAAALLLGVATTASAGPAAAAPAAATTAAAPAPAAGQRELAAPRTAAAPTATLGAPAPLAPAEKGLPAVLTAAVPAAVAGKVAALIATDAPGVRVAVEVHSAGGKPTFTHVVAADAASARATISNLAAAGVRASLDIPVRVADTGTPDPFRSRQWHLDTLGADNLAAQAATGTGAVVAVVDTGVQVTHEDLAGQVLAGYDFVANTATMSDPHGHGTFCAGEIAALAHNGIGGAGLAPDAKVLPVRVLDANGSGYGSTVAQGIIWAVDHGANVISLSLAGSGADSAESDAVIYAENHGVTVIAAAGNFATQGNPVEYPAAFPTVLAVAATDVSNAHASFSEIQPYVGIAAPGVSVLSTDPQYGYLYMSGTSMATPLVAATAALVHQAHPDFTPAQVRAALESTATDLGDPGRDASFGYGLLNPAAALGLPAAPPALTGLTLTTAPVAGSTVSGQVPLAAAVTGIAGGTAARVVYTVDGTDVVTGTAGTGYAASWDSTTVPDGVHTLSAYAVEATTGQRIDASFGPQVRVANVRPSLTSVTLLNPQSGTRVLGPVMLSAQVVTDGINGAVGSVTYIVNGTVVGTSRTGPTYSVPWNTWTGPNGDYVITATATEASTGTTVTSAPVLVTVTNPVPVPPAPQPVPPAPKPPVPPAPKPAPKAAPHVLHPVFKTVPQTVTVRTVVHGKVVYVKKTIMVKVPVMVRVPTTVTVRTVVHGKVVYVKKTVYVWRQLMA